VSSKQSTAELAYHLWNARGRPHGSEKEDWLEAERQLAPPKEADRDASHSPDLRPSNVENKSNPGDKRSAAGRKSRQPRTISAKGKVSPRGVD
jgi:hypothetical protein